MAITLNDWKHLQEGTTAWPWSFIVSTSNNWTIGYFAWMIQQLMN